MSAAKAVTTTPQEQLPAPLALLGCLIFSIAQCIAAEPLTLYVSPAGNDTAVCGQASDAAACQSLSYTLSNRIPGQFVAPITVFVAQGTYSDYGMTITFKTLRIIGQGDVKFDAGLSDGRAPFFTLRNSTVLLHGLELTRNNGEEDSATGVLATDGSKLIVNNCVFRDQGASVLDGAVVLLIHSQLEMSDSRVLNCFVPFLRGLNAPRIVLRNSSVQQTTYGGMVNVDNRKTEPGSATTHQLTMTGVRFETNSDTQTTGTVSDLQFRGGELVEISLTDVTFQGGREHTVGGGLSILVVAIPKANVTVERLNCTSFGGLDRPSTRPCLFFAHVEHDPGATSATLPAGLAGAADAWCSLIVHNSRFADNTVADDILGVTVGAAGLHFETFAPGLLSISDSEFSRNVRTVEYGSHAGAGLSLIFNAPGIATETDNLQVNITNTRIENNRLEIASTLITEDCALLGAGIALELRRGATLNLTVVGCTIASNLINAACPTTFGCSTGIQVLRGAGLYLTVDPSSQLEISIADTAIESNSIINDATNAVPNSVHAAGAGMYLAAPGHSSTSLRGVAMSDNHILVSANLDGSVMGAALYIEPLGNYAGNLVAIGCTFSRNDVALARANAKFYGAAAMQIESLLVFTLERCEFLNHSADASSGTTGSVASVFAAVVIMRGCLVRNSQTTGVGLVRGTVWIGLRVPIEVEIAASALIEDSIWDSNSLLVNGHSSGAGLFVASKDIELKDKDVVIRRCRFVRNRVDSEDAAIVSGAALSIQGSGLLVRIEGTLFDGNIARAASMDASLPQAAGGAISLSFESRSSVALAGCTFIGNSAEGPDDAEAVLSRGGALFVSFRGLDLFTLAVTDSVFRENGAQAGGSILAVLSKPREPSEPFGIQILGCNFTSSISSQSAVSVQGAYADDPAVHVFISNSFFESLDATAVSIRRAGNAVICNSLFINCSSDSVGGIDLGAITGSLSDLVFKGSTGSAADAIQFSHPGDFFVTRTVVVAADISHPLVTGDRLGNITVLCPLGAPASPAGNILACVPCKLGEYDIGIIAKDGSVVAGPTCYRCKSAGLLCELSAGVSVPYGYFSKTLHSAEGGRFLDTQLCSFPGMCCTRPSCHYDYSCAPGRDPLSPLCARCLPNHSEAFGTSSCLKSTDCGNAQSTLIVLGSFLLLLLFVVWQWRNRTGNSTAAGSFKSLLFFFQVADLVRRESSGPLQVVGTAIISISNLQLGFGSDGTTGACLWEMTAETKLLWPLLVPLLLYGLFLSLLPVLKWRHCSCCRTAGSTDEHQIVRMTWIFALTSFASIAKTAFNILTCRDFEGQFVLSRIADTECFKAWYQVFSFTLLLPLVLGFPVLLFWLSRNASRFPTAAAVVQQAYGQHAFWYESATMSRRLLLIVLATFIYDKVARAYVLFLTCCLLLAIHVRLQPFASAAANRTETVLLSLLCIMASALIDDSHSLELGSGDNPGIAGILQGLALLAALLIVTWFFATTPCFRLYQRLHSGRATDSSPDDDPRTSAAYQPLLTTSSHGAETKRSVAFE